MNNACSSVGSSVLNFFMAVILVFQLRGALHCMGRVVFAAGPFLSIFHVSKYFQTFLLGRGPCHKHAHMNIANLHGFATYVHCLRAC